MRIKSLEMSGFKSFVDRTVINFEEGITGVVGPNGCGKCVRGDTLVPLSDGRVATIQSLVENAFACAESVGTMDDGEYTYDNPDNVSVISLDMDTLKMRHRPVTAFVRRTSPKKLLKVTTESGRSVTATEYHPLFINVDGEVRPVRADKLCKGVHIATPRTLPVRPDLTCFAAKRSGEVAELSAAGSCRRVTSANSNFIALTGVIPAEKYNDVIPAGCKRGWNPVILKSKTGSPITALGDDSLGEVERGAGKFECSDIYWDEVISVEKIEGDEWVYDLCVEGDHNFVANDIIVHNSNVVDAIRWVMGEMSAKHLRGVAMEDVIFNGCETRPAVGMSQVFLTFDNSDGRAPADYASYSEIQVGRRLYRSGESEYFINKTPCRLKDIVDLFLGTGVGTKAYSIIEQGKVSKIVQTSPEDRRMLVEEAAGISRFKSRKEAALRKMESTRQNLARLTDILSELTRQMNSLHRQAKKAERYGKIAGELKTRELTLAAAKYRKLREELSALTSDNTKLKELEAGSQAELAGEESALEAGRLAIAELENRLDGIQQELYRSQNSIKLHEANIAHREEEASSTEQRMRTCASDIENLERKLSELVNRVAESNERMIDADLRLAGSKGEVSGKETILSEVRSKNEWLLAEADSLNKQVMSDSESLADAQAALTHLERSRIGITGRIAKGQAEIDAIDRRRARIDDELSRKDKELDGVRQIQLGLEEESGAAAASLDEQRANLAQAEERFFALRDAAAEKRSRFNSLNELRRNMEGYREGVKAVLSMNAEGAKRLSGVMGTVGDAVETDAEYERALGAVLGEKLQYVVVKSHENGVEAIDYLRQASAGRSTFIPMSLRHGEAAEALPEGEGVIGPLMNYVRFSDDYRSIGRHLLGDVVLVEDLGVALCCWQDPKYRKTYVTKDGCVVDPSGVVTGGAGECVEEQLIAQKRRAQELGNELSALTGELATARGEVLKLKERVASIEANIERLKKDVHGEELKFVGQERDAMRLREEASRLEKERDAFTVELAQFATDLERLEHEQNEARERMARHTASRDAARERLSAIGDEAGAVSALLSEKERDVIECKLLCSQAGERAASAENEQEGLVRTKAEMHVALGRLSAELSESSHRVALLRREIEDFKFGLDLALRSVTKLEDARREFLGRIEAEQALQRERELSIREIRRRHEEALSKFHEVELVLTEHRGRMNYLADGIRERYRMELMDVEAQYYREGIDLEAEDAEVAGLKESIEKIGAVNVDAIKEYEELSERNIFLTAQHADLTASLDNLAKAIAKINRTSRQRFRRAFDLVDGQFQILFPKLFKGGKARLMLTDEENLLETGVEIIAQPSGKKLRSITLLSGGEQALTAVALIFSIFLIKPSPFCILDEVDAPFDDANIDRFNDLIRSMISHSQFILITHNKRTMEQADILYGVTMEEAGVSKMVSVRMDSDKALPAVA